MVDYKFYTDIFHGGSIAAAEWPAYERAAADHLARYKRIYTVTEPEGTEDAEAMAICAMAEALHGFDLIANGEGGAIQSASIGSVSTSWGSSGTDAVDISPAAQAKELYRCACLYLEIYRGVS